MQTETSAINDYAAAVAFERAAWDAVRHRLPGSTGFDNALWLQWRLSVEQADRAAARARTPASTPPPKGMIGWCRPKAIQLSPILSRLRQERPLP